MDRTRLYKIIDFNKNNKGKTAEECYGFYHIMGFQPQIIIPDIQSLAAILFEKMGFKFLRIPMNSKEIGAFWLRFNDLNYLILNTSRSRAYCNFALAHELYHVFIEKDVQGNSADVYLNKYGDDENEMRANAFAASILMPEENFYSIYRLIEQSDEINVFRSIQYADKVATIIAFMSYYKTTFMSVLIRCFELGIFDLQDEDMVEALLKYNNERKQKEICDKIAQVKGQISIMEPTCIDDFQTLYEDAKRSGEEQITRCVLTREDLEYRLEGMRSAYKMIREAGV